MSEAGRKILDIRVKDDEISTQRFVDLDSERADFLRTEGWGVVSFGGSDDGGLTSHRGVTHPDEYVDPFSMRDQVEQVLGFTYADISAAYRQGPKSAKQRQQRDEIDARVLALSRAGGNMAEFAKALGLLEKTVDRALSRARAVEVEPVPYTPVTSSSRPCFICCLPGRTRKRRTSQSPEKERGTITLCDIHYAAGFNPRPGNPRYWEFRTRGK